MKSHEKLAISRIVVVVIIIVILAIAGGVVYFATLGTSSTSSTTVASSTSSSSASASSSHVSSSVATTATGASSITTHTSSASVSTSVSTTSTSSCPSTSQITSASATGPSVKITFSYPAPTIQFAPVAIADQLGIFSHYGLSVSYSILSDVASTSGLESGSLQMAYSGYGEEVHIIASGANISMLGMSSPAGSPFYLYTKPSITTPQQMIGQSVGVLAPKGSSGERAASFILKALGLNESQVQITYLQGANTVLTALLAGTISVGEISPPRTIIAAANGFKQIGPASTDAGYPQPDVVVTTPSYLANNPVVVNNFLKSLLIAYHDMWVTALAEPNVTMSNGVNTTAVLSAMSTLLHFNNSMVDQALRIYQSKGLLGPTMLPDNATMTTAYNADISEYPQDASANVASSYNFGMINELNAPCGFVYYLYGGSPPPAPS